jgi:hypothetical protein
MYDNMLIFGTLTLDNVGDGVGVNTVELNAINGNLDLNGNKILTSVSSLAETQLPISGATAGTYGSGTSVPSFTVDQYGRITSITSTGISVTVGQANVIKPTQNYTILDTDDIILAASAITVTIPSAVNANKGKVYHIKRLGGPLIINVASNGTIDGETSIIIESKYASITVCSDGTAWWII